MGKPSHLMTEDERQRRDAYQREYRARNAGRLREYRHRSDVKEKRYQANREWVAANPEAVRAAARERYAKAPSKKRASAAAYRVANPDAVKKAMQAWSSANPEKRGEYNRNAKARRKRAEGSHTQRDIHALYKLQRGACASCRVELNAFHVDHIVALARGGTNDRLNLQLLCPTCNLRKGAKHPVEFMQQMGFLL